MLLAIALFTIPSCTSGVTQQEYDRVSNELRAIQNQLVSLQGKLAEAEQLQEVLTKQSAAAKSELEAVQARYKELSAEHEGLSEQFEATKNELEAMQDNYEELSAEYDELDEQFQELGEQYNIIIEGRVEIDEKDVEEALFKLINQERVNEGLDEIALGENLYKWALTNSKIMATNQREEYSDYGSWQAVYWTAGHSTPERMADTILTVWKGRQEYERFFLNVTARYGAIGIYKSGEIFYITYIADYFH
jgi:archaellum component FlaC